MGTSDSVWKNQASQWERVGPPLRPSQQDHERLEDIIHEWTAKNGAPRALVLGVTPEMARLKWPGGTRLLAVDRSQEMIDKVWPGYPGPGEGVLCANWLDLPLEKQSRDLVVSDGPFGVLRYPNEYREVLKGLHKIIQPGGYFAFRIFVRPEKEEEPATVYDAAMKGKIGNFHAFKLRLLMARQPDSRSGVRTGDVWKEWSDNGPGIETLSDKCGWPPEQIQTIEAYRGKNDIYSFPTLSEIREIVKAENFSEINCSRPSYELGERCPTLLFTPEK